MIKSGILILTLGVRPRPVISSFSVTPGGCGDGVFLFLEPASDWPGHSLLIGRALEEELTSEGDFDEDDAFVVGTGRDTVEGLDEEEGLDEDDDGLDGDEGSLSFITSAVSASHFFISLARLPFSLLKQTRNQVIRSITTKGQGHVTSIDQYLSPIFLLQGPDSRLRCLPQCLHFLPQPLVLPLHCLLLSCELSQRLAQLLLLGEVFENDLKQQKIGLLS